MKRLKPYHKGIYKTQIESDIDEVRNKVNKIVDFINDMCDELLAQHPIGSPLYLLAEKHKRGESYNTEMKLRIAISKDIIETLSDKSPQAVSRAAKRIYDMVKK